MKYQLCVWLYLYTCWVSVKNAFLTVVCSQSLTACFLRIWDTDPERYWSWDLLSEPNEKYKGSLLTDCLPATVFLVLSFLSYQFYRWENRVMQPISFTTEIQTDSYLISEYGLCPLHHGIFPVGKEAMRTKEPPVGGNSLDCLRQRQLAWLLGTGPLGESGRNYIWRMIWFSICSVRKKGTLSYHFALTFFFFCLCTTLPAHSYLTTSKDS